MTTVVNNSMTGGFITQEEQYQRMAYMREARRQGHEFIRLKLNEAVIQREDVQSEVKFNGVQTIAVFPAGRGKGGHPKYEVQVRGGELLFKYTPDEDPTKDGWYADMLDDKSPAIYAEKGYNRDFLASHLASKEFIIIDPKVKRDVTMRAKKIAEVTKKKEEENKERRASNLKSHEQRKQELEEEIKLAREQQAGGLDADNETGGGVD